MKKNLKRLPVIVASGGINASGRTSFHDAARVLTYESLNHQGKERAKKSLSSLGVQAKNPLEGACVRPYAPFLSVDDGHGVCTVAGGLPDGFDPRTLYSSRAHPKNLSMMIFAASDAILSSGLEIDSIVKKLGPEKVGVFSSSSIGGHDEQSWGGMHASWIKGERPSAKQLPLGYPQMAADFVSAYVLGQFGVNYSAMGACATFLYNLDAASSAIQNGRIRFALVGSSDAPLSLPVMRSFLAMGALAKDQNGGDPTKTSLPFGENRGMVLGESAQAFLLMDAELALEIGAPILGAVPEVFIRADGPKASITAPGVGNYITFLRAMQCASRVFGDELEQSIYVMAHGSSTPQNRVSESEIISRCALTMGCKALRVSAIKGLLGHTQGSASSDQLSMSLSVEPLGRIAGIETTETLASDVQKEGLKFLLKAEAIEEGNAKAAILNSKGFGGNNASALYFSESYTKSLLKKAGFDIDVYQRAHEAVQKRSMIYEKKALEGSFDLVYRFGEGVLSSKDIKLQKNAITINETLYPLEDDPRWDSWC